MGVAVGDIFRVRYYCYLQSQLSVNIVYYNVLLVGGAPTWQILADDLSTRAAAKYKPLMPTVAQYYGLRMQRVPFAAFGDDVVSAVGRGAGTATGDELPKQISGLLGWVTGVPGRPYRGRVYLPFPSASNSINGVPDSTYQTNALAWGNALRFVNDLGTAPDTAKVQGIIFHRTGGGFTYITSAVARAKWATQKRRGDYGRTNILPF